MQAPAWTVEYRCQVRTRAAELRSDGCSGPALDAFHRDACLEHDVHYRTGQTLDGQPISRPEADALFRRRMQAASIFGPLSPMAWWRWTAVRLFGRCSWRGALR